MRCDASVLLSGMEEHAGWLLQQEVQVELVVRESTAPVRRAVRAVRAHRAVPAGPATGPR